MKKGKPSAVGFVAIAGMSTKTSCSLLVTLLLCGVLICSPIFSQGQTLSSNALFNFLRQHFDSTVVFCTYSTWNTAPNYKIIAKKGHQHYLFTYCSPYDLQKKYPDSLQSRFIRLQTNFQLMEPDVNEYFLPKISSDSAMDNFWKRLCKEQLWFLVSTRDELDCIDSAGRRNDIYDAGELFFSLITKTGYQKIDFYAPAFFEAHCPGNRNRIQAIKISNMFSELFH